MSMPPACSEHSDMIRNTTKAVALSEQLAEALPRLFARLDAHLSLEAHPTAQRRLNGIERAQEKQMAALEAVTNNAKANTQAITELREDRALRLDRGTKVIVALIGVGGPLLAVGGRFIARVIWGV